MSTLFVYSDVSEIQINILRIYLIDIFICFTKKFLTLTFREIYKINYRNVIDFKQRKKSILRGNRNSVGH